MNLTRALGFALLSATLAVTSTGSSAFAAGVGSLSVSGASATGSAIDISDLRLPDPHKELRHLSRNLRLSKNQRTAVGGILQERSREIRLLLDVQPVSQDYRNTLAAKVIQDSNSQIESFLKNKQKRKFDKELARGRETH
jgi:hypothetical protein